VETKARELVVQHMANPWAHFMRPEFLQKKGPSEDELSEDKKKKEEKEKHKLPLRVKLEVDCKSAPTWYEAK
jgi:hypothetical protein